MKAVNKKGLLSNAIVLGLALGVVGALLLNRLIRGNFDSLGYIAPALVLGLVCGFFIHAVWSAPGNAGIGNLGVESELELARARISELERERAVRRQRIEGAKSATEASAISSPTLQRIIEAVEQYPAWREEQSQEPNLKAVLGWQENQQKDKGNGSRVAHVAHHVIAEHFGLKS